MSASPGRNPSVRVRFAPSPTGHIHVGNARTALFNWLFARQHGGAFLLRIEDTDVARSEQRFESQIFDDLRWLGLDWDEGPDCGGPYAPYRQSERLDLYREHAERLLAEGKAYLCFCSAEELEQQRQRAMAEHRSPVYPGTCRAVDPADGLRRRRAGEQAAIRLRVPHHPIRFHDLVHGTLEFPSEVVSDPIILRSSGMPVYNYVVVIDDAEMKITHVIRGDDHLSNTPKQVALYEALGWAAPEFAHLSTILGSDRERLSKRHGATSIENFRAMGALPEALRNYLALLGWAPSGGDREIFSKDELVKEFRLERVTPSPAAFDLEKLHWLNRHYIREAAPERLFMLAAPFFLQAGYFGPEFKDGRAGGFGTVMPPEGKSWLQKVIALLAPSVDRLEQLPLRAGRVIFRYDAKLAAEDPDNAEALRGNAGAVLGSFVRHLRDVPSGGVTPERFKIIMNEVKTETGATGKELFHPVRVAVTGSHSGPEFDKVIPLIEEGSRLKLPENVLSVRERVEAFLAVRDR